MKLILKDHMIQVDKKGKIFFVSCGYSIDPVEMKRGDMLEVTHTIDFPIWKVIWAFISGKKSVTVDPK